MNHYATYFDAYYLPRALVLFESLDRHDPGWSASVLALDGDCAAALAALGRDNLEIVPLEALEADEPRLAGAKAERSRVEYYFTCGPAFLDRVLRTHPDLPALTYADADLCFFSSPAPAYAELAGASVGLSSHRFSPRNRKCLEAGEFNVGWLWFRNDAAGRGAVAWWKERCLEWCFDRFEDGRYADQKYLEALPGLFPGVHVMEHPGVNAAPWNMDGRRFTVAGRPWSAGDWGVEVEGRPLIVFHMAGIHALGPRLYRALGADYGARFWGALRRRVYRPYLEALDRVSGGEDGARQRRYPRAAITPRGALRFLKHAAINGSVFIRLGGRVF